MNPKNKALLMELQLLIAYMAEYAGFAEHNSSAPQIASPEQVDSQMELIEGVLSALYQDGIIELITVTYKNLSLQANPAYGKEPIH